MKNVIHNTEIRNKCEITGATNLTLTNVQNVAFAPVGGVAHPIFSILKVKWKLKIFGWVESNSHFP